MQGEGVNCSTLKYVHSSLNKKRRFQTKEEEWEGEGETEDKRVQTKSLEGKKGGLLCGVT